MRQLDGKGAIWLDGRMLSIGSACIPIDDPGLQAGLGVFETLALRDGRVIDLEPHLRRLETGAGVLSIELPSRKQLLATVDEAARSSTVPFGWLKLLPARSFCSSITLSGREESGTTDRSFGTLAGIFY